MVEELREYQARLGALRFPPAGKVSYRVFPDWNEARANRFKELFGILKEYEDVHQPTRDLVRQLKATLLEVVASWREALADGCMGRRPDGSVCGRSVATNDNTFNANRCHLHVSSSPWTKVLDLRPVPF